jgi:hypothetical protein
MAKLQTQLTDQLRDHQTWWISTAKGQAAGAGDPIGDEAAIARAKATAMNAAAANASAKAAAAQAEEAMENVQVQVTQVLKQTKPEVPLRSPAKEVQPEEAMENVQVQVTHRY